MSCSGFRRLRCGAKPKLAELTKQFAYVTHKANRKDPLPRSIPPNTQLMAIFKTSRRVEFRDTDAAGIVHFSNFFVYMEQAEHAFLRSVGLGVICEIDGQKTSWPRVNAECNYRNAIRFEDMIDIHVSVRRIGSKSMTYGFEFFRGQTLVAEGLLTTVCCLFEHGSSPQSVPIPAQFVEAVKPFLAE